MNLRKKLRRDFLGGQAQGHRHPVKDGFRPGRTSRDEKVDRENLIQSAQGGVGIEPDVATGGAAADRDHQFGVRNRVVKFLQGGDHLPGYRPGNQEDIRVPGRAHQLDPEALGVVVRREHVDYLDIAAVAGPGIGMENPEGFGKGFGAKFLQRSSQSSN